MSNNTPVSSIMSRYLITVTPNTILDKVTAIFAQHDFHHLPVVDDGFFVGIISRTDIDRVSNCIDLFHSKANENYNVRLFSSLLAEEVMTTHATIIAPENTVGQAAALFAANKFHALPVVKEGKLVGLVTTFDLIDYAFNAALKPVLVA